MRRTGSSDISYCNTNCLQGECKRNLYFWKPPTKFYSVTSFDKECSDMLHPKCKHKWLAEDYK